MGHVYDDDAPEAYDGGELRMIGGSPHKWGGKAIGWIAVTNTPRPGEAPGARDRTPIIKTQVGGDHYAKMKVQPIEYILANNVPFVEANVIKYVSRWRAKGGVEDLKKARHMLDLLIAHEEKKPE